LAGPRRNTLAIARNFPGTEADLAELLGRPPVASLDAVAQAADSWPTP
jgi:hypothetical protein